MRPGPATREVQVTTSPRARNRAVSAERMKRCTTRQPIVQAIGRQPQWVPDAAPVHFERHRPEQTTLYRLVQQHAASFIAHT